MNPVAAFFAKLVGAHLLFWRLSFKVFDAIPLFVAVLAMLGLTELSKTQEIKGAGQYVLVQFVVSVFCYAFCYVWPKFRQQYLAISMNMICLSLSVAFLAGLFALCSHLILSADALRDTFGTVLERFIYGDLARLPFDVERTYMFILFLTSYCFFMINTLIVEGRKGLACAFLGWNIIPTGANFLASYLASLLVMAPIVFSPLA